MSERIRWKNGFSCKVKAEVVKAQIDQIRDQSGGVVSPAQIVQAARTKGSPLGPCFDWNKDRAAQAHWEDRARQLTRSIEIVRVDDQGRRSSEPAYISIAQPFIRGSAYQDTREALADPTSRDIALQIAWSQFEGWKKRWGRLTEVADFIRQVEALQIPVA